MAEVELVREPEDVVEVELVGVPEDVAEAGIAKVPADVVEAEDVSVRVRVTALSHTPTLKKAWWTRQ